MESFRKELDCETSLVVIGCGDDFLRVGQIHRKRLLITQSFVDKNIVEEISYFITLHTTHNTFIPPTTAPTPTRKTKGRPKTKKDGTPRAPYKKTGESKRKRAYSSGMAEERSILRTADIGDTKFSPSGGNAPSEYDFMEGPSKQPAPISTNKRKQNYRASLGSAPKTTTPLTAVTTSTSDIVTASKLVQQSKNKNIFFMYNS